MSVRMHTAMVTAALVAAKKTAVTLTLTVTVALALVGFAARGVPVRIMMSIMVTAMRTIRATMAAATEGAEGTRGTRGEVTTIGVRERGMPATPGALRGLQFKKFGFRHGSYAVPRTPTTASTASTAPISTISAAHPGAAPAVATAAPTPPYVPRAALMVGTRRAVAPKVESFPAASSHAAAPHAAPPARRVRSSASVAVRTSAMLVAMARGEGMGVPVARSVVMGSVVVGPVVVAIVAARLPEGVPAPERRSAPLHDVAYEHEARGVRTDLHQLPVHGRLQDAPLAPTHGERAAKRVHVLVLHKTRRAEARRLDGDRGDGTVLVEDAQKLVNLGLVRKTLDGELERTMLPHAPAPHLGRYQTRACVCLSRDLPSKTSSVIP